MKSHALVLVFALAAGEAVAGSIYKCVDGGATSYQSVPCARGQSETTLTVASASLQRTRDLATEATTAGAQPRKRGPWTRTAVEVGISDDEVLNMPGWGRPHHITRTRVARGWEEVWRYGNIYTGERALRFVNARLADIVETPAALASAR